ncbi:GNAT family N-acetyltransferase [Lactococcus lactis]|uniref:GNAT family N-acetyltransferase n=1 Tax=Lactococcus lactis TaxID=1358 RepID=UPI001021DB8B|nr:GNAT family N-acetyltransferase [Lactococcus lactis]MCT0437580.1 GNAT family N-acetyltransferase [Lactococcus lactis subsp. lactis]MCT2919848.1 GNAT family N-acetyltransferase [Lactococcus lactis]NLS46910.1 GNAT family N-acetyltransferase [Lactococcus lactis]QBC37634.1 GNAT family N-acetyltransferase [Lactococcus lactis]UCS90489.1 GNAT family N-acetyltransferase [Lactococcus lactis]
MIRKAEMKDYLDIARLSGVLGYPISEVAVKKNLARILKDADHEFLVFELGERVTAFIESEIYAPVYAEQVMLNVLGLVVDEKNQGQGIGAQLLNALEEKAKAREIKVIRLNSGVQRHEAHQFYEHQGYTSNHSQKRFLKFL